MEPEIPEPHPFPDTGVLEAPTSELDVVESGRTGRRRRGDGKPRPPQVRLGLLDHGGGLAPAIMAIVERGVRRRPALARELQAEVELSLEEYPPVRIVFGDRLVLVEDAPAVAPDLRVKGTLPNVISLMVTPLIGGLPSPMNPKGRAALGMVMVGRVRVEGRLVLMRRLLGIIRI